MRSHSVAELITGQNQEVPSSQLVFQTAPSDAPSLSLDQQPAPGVAIQENESGLTPLPIRVGGHRGSDDTDIENDGDKGNGSNLKTVAGLRVDATNFCRVGDCKYSHKVPRQVRRHRETHFPLRHGWFCPNRTVTCPSLGKDFRRRDAVKVHCDKYPACRKAFQAKNGEIQDWGDPVSEEDLVPYNPEFHQR